MIVEAPLHLDLLPARPRLADIAAVWRGAYPKGFVEVASNEEASATRELDPEMLNGSNRLRLYVFGDDGARQARLCAVLDNLGKGASGAAVQNLNLMLGCDEAAGL